MKTQTLKLLFTLTSIFLTSTAFAGFDPAIYDEEARWQQGQNYRQERQQDNAYQARRREAEGCTGRNCPVVAIVDKSTQTLRLYELGELIATWDVSTGAAGHATPNFSGHPAGPVHERYSSKTYPGGGNYNGLGNMPYAVFIKGPYAIHGTTATHRLGQEASHGCVRLHPEDALYFNRIVRHYGLNQVWIVIR